MTAGMFSGRAEELEILENILYQTKQGNPHHFAITGERGIGKSSLLFYLTLVARGEIDSWEGNLFRFLVLNIELQPTTSYLEIIKKIGAELERTISSHEKAKELVKSVWEFLSRWEAFGVKYRGGERKEAPPELLEDLTHTTAEVIARMKSEFDGLLILIDEADKPPTEAGLGQFTKLFTEGLLKRGCENVAVGLAGLPTLLGKLRSSHESSLRIFQFMRLLPLLPEERISVIRRGLAEAKQKNGYDVTATSPAEKMIANFSEGYPHFIQQFAYSAFLADSDNEIDDVDVLKGAFKEEGGAIQQLGIRYFENLYFDQIWSDEYREVLRAMSNHGDQPIDRSTLQKECNIRTTTLDNALRALKSRGIILPLRGKKGKYRLPTQSFAVWIKVLTEAQRQNESPSGQLSFPTNRPTG